MTATRNDQKHLQSTLAEQEPSTHDCACSESVGIGFTLRGVAAVARKKMRPAAGAKAVS